ncbi:TPA: DUF551 domain-containing protein [Klebsiella pneumoniae]|nr:DUF551 domain-containing protein [Klebsiella pneumoniae]
MTKSTITREQLIKKAQEQIEFCRHTKITGEGRAHVNQCAALFEIALAAMDSEPVELPLDYLQGHKDGLEWASQLAEANHPETGDWLYDDPIELAKAIRKGPDMPPAQPVADSEPDRNPVLAYADSYRDMAKQGVESVPIWSVITDLERNIAPLYRHAQPAPVVPNGLRLALSNAGIAAPESDEMLAATCEKHIQALVTWVKDRKPFQSAPVVPSFEEWLSAANRKPLGWVKDAMREAYDACRAAMLQAGNSPVIPDGYRLQPISEYEAMCATVNSDEWPQRWIPVSERMPEDRTQVILWDAEIGEVTSGHYSHKTHTFYHCGDAIQNEITHWMPPPCAPQEVNRE